MQRLGSLWVFVQAFCKFSVILHTTIFFVELCYTFCVMIMSSAIEVTCLCTALPLNHAIRILTRNTLCFKLFPFKTWSGGIIHSVKMIEAFLGIKTESEIVIKLSNRLQCFCLPSTAFLPFCGNISSRSNEFLRQVDHKQIFLTYRYHDINI